LLEIRDQYIELNRYFDIYVESRSYKFTKGLCNVLEAYESHCNFVREQLSKAPWKKQLGEIPMLPHLDFVSDLPTSLSTMPSVVGAVSTASKANVLGAKATYKQNRLTTATTLIPSGIATDNSSAEGNGPGDANTESSESNMVGEDKGLSDGRKNLGPALTSAWVVAYTDDGYEYYYHEITGESKWEHPTDPLH